MNAPYTPPGWYPDPADARWERYWDGRYWTPATRPTMRPITQPAWGTPAPPVVATQQWQAYRPSSVSGEPRRPTKKLRWILAGVAALLVVVAALGNAAPEEPPATAGKDTPSTASSEASGDLALETEEPTQVPTEEPVEPTEEPVLEPEHAVVPVLVGLDVVSARRKLRRAGLVIEVVERRPSSRPSGTVLGQAVDRGRWLAPGASVAVVVAAALPVVPSVVAIGAVDARRRLERLGFSVAVTKERVTSGTDGAVLRQSRTGAARPGAHVVLVVARLVLPVVQEPVADNCTPGYDPCLLPASDYDCEGGSGNGPAYTGYVEVTGSDPYDLDADGDGVGCE